ncbi:DinB family protein [Changchengzhania lutea]|uniref:DinB family protein n=1 Tax=Changchengzhania lutea TaxID=2049305 RepID=UPI00115D65CF|nr:DinB family protein [Changchengzhania lutea]
MKTKDLSFTEYNAYYSQYLNMLSGNLDLIGGYNQGLSQIIEFFKTIPEGKLTYSYAAGKWTIKEVFQHIIDTERVFMYRCFRIARRDITALAGFEQDDYIAPSKANKKSLEQLLEEYRTVRESSIVFLKSLSEVDLEYLGNANGTSLSARAAAFILLGHEKHHVEIIQNRYLA